jgi:serpin B
MYLINAIYFKSSWKEKFDPAATSKQPFLLDDGSRVQTDFMSGTIDFNYFQNNDVNVFELPYANSKYSMVIIIPTGSTTVQQLISGIDPTKWNTWITGLSPKKNFFEMPKFKFSYGTSLNNALTALGMGIAFSNSADFSRINATMPLAISDVEHKAYIDVDEDGTTAAAVTSVGITPTISLGYTISHPFMFVIREMSSGLIVFAGTVNNPLLTGN